MKKMKAESGADAFAGLASARVTNEENYLFQKLFRAEALAQTMWIIAHVCATAPPLPAWRPHLGLQLP
jgi:predicted molibdopterin-dependent oxidoreductase YjgC